MSPNSNHTVFIYLAVRSLSAQGAIEEISDEFTPSFIRLKSVERAATIIDVETKFKQLQDAGNQWMVSAFSSIANRFDQKELIEYYNRKTAVINTDSQPDGDNIIGNETLAIEDEWSPITIDRTRPEYSEAIDAAEAALREIEASNGYASSNIQERNAIVATIRGSINALKDGTPSRGAVIEGLMKPLRFVAKKFSEATLGEIAKIAVARLAASITNLMS